MNKGFGIAALVVSIIAVFVPVVGAWLTLIAAFLAVFAYGAGFALGISSLVLNVINVMFLSPSLWITVMGLHMARINSASVHMFLIGAQLLAGAILLMQHKRRRLPVIQA